MAPQELALIIKAQNQTSTAFQQINASLDGLAKSTVKLVAGYVSLRAATDLVTSSLKAQADQEASINKLNLALANQGNLTEATSKSLQAFATEIQNTTTASDDAALAGMAMAASFGMNEEQIRRTTLAALDLSAATGTDLETSFQLLSKAFVGNTTALGKLGFEFKKTDTDAQKFDSAIKQVEGRFAGSATAATQTFTGQMLMLENQVDDAKEGFGFFLGELLRTEDVAGKATTILQGLGTWFRVDLVIALSEARASYLEFMASLVDVSSLIAKIISGPMGERSRGGLWLKSLFGESDPAKLAAALRDQATALRAIGDAAAIAGVKTQTYANAMGGAKNALDELTAAQKKAAKELQDDILDAEKLKWKDAADEYKRYLKEYAEGVKRQDEISKDSADAYLDNWTATLGNLSDRWNDYWDEQERQFEAEQVQLEEKLTLLSKQAQLIRDLTSLYVLFGGSASDALGSVLVAIQGGIDAIKQWKAAGEDAFGKAGAVATGVFAIGGMIDSWVETARAAEERIRKLKEEFEALIPAALAAGIAIDSIVQPENGFLRQAMDAAKLRAEIDKIKDGIDLWEEATNKTRAAMERYGITIDQMGERFAQQELDKMFGDLYQDYQLLIAAGADVALVNEKMADAINKYIQDSIKAGTEIPIAMKPILQSLIDQGLLTDAAGNKLTNLSGIEFSESITQSINEITTAIMLLVEALYRGLGITREFGDALMNLKYKDIPGYGGNPPPPPKAEGGWFPFRAGGYPVTVGEAGNEAIIPEEKLAGIVARAVAMAGGSNMGGGNLVVNSKVHIDGREIGKASSKAERRRQLRRHPNGEHTGRW